MNPALSQLIDALREELKQYGEMLAQLDQQQEFLIQRAADRLVDCAAGIEGQTQKVEQARQHRAACQRELALTLELLGDAAFADLIPLLDEPHRLLVAALTEENNALLVRVHQRSRQNHLLLLRSLQFMNQLVSTLFPSGAATYTGTGTLHGPPLRVRSVYEAIS